MTTTTPTTLDAPSWETAWDHYPDQLYAWVCSLVHLNVTLIDHPTLENLRLHHDLETSLDGCAVGWRHHIPTILVELPKRLGETARLAEVPNPTDMEAIEAAISRAEEPPADA